jgi:hypothetical protein
LVLSPSMWRSTRRLKKTTATTVTTVASNTGSDYKCTPAGKVEQIICPSCPVPSMYYCKDTKVHICQTGSTAIEGRCYIPCFSDTDDRLILGSGEYCIAPTGTASVGWTSITSNHDPSWCDTRLNGRSSVSPYKYLGYGSTICYKNTQQVVHKAVCCVEDDGECRGAWTYAFQDTHPTLVYCSI